MKFLKLAIVAVAALFLFSCRNAEKDVMTLRFAHYNVGAYNKTDDSSTDVIAKMLLEAEAEVVSVNEVDSCTTRTGLVDQLAQMSKAMGDWKCWYAPAMPFRGGAYGIGISYKPEFEVVRTDMVNLPKLTGSEPRALAVVEFENFVFASTHLDYATEDAQVGQIAVINAYMDENYGNSGKPVFLCGDFNCVPGSKPVEIMLESWTQLSPCDLTYPAVEPVKCIDYVFVRPGDYKVKVKSAEVRTEFKSGNVKTASDHLPVVVEVEIHK